MEAWVQILLTIVGTAISSWAAITFKLVRLEGRVDTLEKEVGTDNTGLRSRVQEHARHLAELEIRTTSLEERSR